MTKSEREMGAESPRNNFLPYAGMTRIRFEGSQRCRLSPTGWSQPLPGHP
jgi:hypothetical protein